MEEDLVLLKSMSLKRNKMILASQHLHSSLPVCFFHTLTHFSLPHSSCAWQALLMVCPSCPSEYAYTSVLFTIRSYIVHLAYAA
jgi:hypothetical protein